MRRGFSVRVFTLLAAISCAAGARPDIPIGYRQIAHEYAIPPELFYAVALTESGKPIGTAATLRPWPWTLNIAGMPHYFERRQAAERALVRGLASGQDLIDVGLMQVNWRYHRQHLRDPSSALDPYHNLRIAARILYECHRDRADWWLAVGCYHAPRNAERAEHYRVQVRRHWRRLQAGDAS